MPCPRVTSSRIPESLSDIRHAVLPSEVLPYCRKQGCDLLFMGIVCVLKGEISLVVCEREMERECERPPSHLALQVLAVTLHLLPGQPWGSLILMCLACAFYLFVLLHCMREEQFT